MPRLLVVLVALFTAPVVIAATVLIVAFGAASPGRAAAAVSETARREIPSRVIEEYQRAAGACTGLPWSVLAAIGWVESGHGQGRIDTTSGDVRPEIRGPALDGRNGTMRIPDAEEPGGFARAHGPMQFLRSTFARWGVLAPGRPSGTEPDADNAWDAIHSAAAYLCAGSILEQLDDLDDALFRYNRSRAYVARVKDKARGYGWDGNLAEPGALAGIDLDFGDDADLPGEVAGALPDAPPFARPPDGQWWVGDVDDAVARMLAQQGKPYVYGATGPNAFDCSGLPVWAFRLVGVALPRTTYLQVVAGVEIPLSRARRGDFLFSFGDRPARNFGHVGVYLGDGTMIVAPHTGAVVRIERVEPSRVQSVRRIVFRPGEEPG